MASLQCRLNIDLFMLMVGGVFRSVLRWLLWAVHMTKATGVEPSIRHTVREYGRAAVGWFHHFRSLLFLADRQAACCLSWV